MIFLELGSTQMRMNNPYISPTAPLMNWVVVSDCASEYGSENDINYPLRKENVNEFTLGIRRVEKFNVESYPYTWFNKAKLQVETIEKLINSLTEADRSALSDVGEDNISDSMSHAAGFVKKKLESLKTIADSYSKVSAEKQKLLVLQPGLYLVDKESIKPIQDYLLKTKVIDQGFYDKTMKAFENVVIPILIIDVNNESDGSGVRTYVGAELVPLRNQQGIRTINSDKCEASDLCNKYFSNHNIQNKELIELPIYHEQPVGELFKGVDMGTVTFPTVIVPYISESNFNAKQFNTFYNRFVSLSRFITSELGKHRSSDLLLNTGVKFRPQITLIDQFIDWVNIKYPNSSRLATTNLIDAVTMYEVLGQVFHNYTLPNKEVVPSIDIFGIVNGVNGGRNPTFWKGLDNSSFNITVDGDGTYLSVSIQIKGHDPIFFSVEDERELSATASVSYLYFCDYMNHLRDSVDASVSLSDNVTLKGCGLEGEALDKNTFIPYNVIKCEELGAYSFNRPVEELIPLLSS